MSTVAPTSHQHRPLRLSLSAARAVSARRNQWLWLLAGLTLAFLVPFVFTDRISLDRDLYYGVYIGSVLAFAGLWLRFTFDEPRRMLTRNWRRGLLLGLVFVAVMVAIVLREASTAHPQGLDFAAALLWRGVVYGFVDGLLLSAFPIVAVFAAFAGKRCLDRRRGKALIAALALGLSVVFTAVYHLGYQDFRSAKLRKPIAGDVVWSVPTLLTLSPLASPITHAGLHVTAVIHSYETDVFLPPHRAAAPAPKISLHACSVGPFPAQCGRLLVAENPDQPNGKIGLNVAVVRARSATPQPDPLFWFAGWGAAGVSDDAANVVSAFGEVNRDRDLVFIDQRGTGSSERICNLPSETTVAKKGLGAVTQAAARCVKRIGPNLRYYTSAVAVDDFDLVRRALGYDKINIYGGSYGVTTGQVYLLRHGAHVRSAVFDSGSLLDVHIFEQGPPNAERAVRLLLDRCAADRACNAAFPNVRREYAEVRARLARAPMSIPGRSVKLTPLTFASALKDLIAYTPGKPAVPRLIHLLAIGDIATAVEDFNPVAVPRKELAYQVLIICGEPWASMRPREVARLSRGTFMEPLAKLNARLTGAGCRSFPPAEVPANLGERVRSSVPILFLTGNEDSADPPANVANAARELPHSRVVVFRAAGHGQLGTSCAQQLIASFVQQGSAEKLDVSCARTAALLPFDTES